MEVHPSQEERRKLEGVVQRAGGIRMFPPATRFHIEKKITTQYPKG